jgi:hypothetical protein
LELEQPFLTALRTPGISYLKKRYRRERLTGRFDRALTVPMQIDADGILVLYLPPAERETPPN